MLINGVAIDSDQTPLPHATIRLRNIEKNEIEQVVIANELGEFTFIARPDVAYVVEIADQAGRVVAVGDVIMANAGEVAGAVVTLPSRLPALAGVFGLVQLKVPMRPVSPTVWLRENADLARPLFLNTVFTVLPAPR